MRGQKSIFCECGIEIELENLLDDVRAEALDDGESSYVENEIKCDVCGSVYQVNASAYVHVEVSVSSVELLRQGFMVNGEPISIDGLGIGDEVPLPDEQYLFGNMIYNISNGIVSNIYNAQIDENQLELAI
jgi:hypothetical protein